MLRRHTLSFKAAFEGVLYALRTQPNFRVHILISALVIDLGLILHISPTEWLFISLIIALGLVIELINTSIETTVDLITREIHPLAKIAKDTAAGAMLIYAIGASVTGLLIFLPKLWLFI